MQTNMASSIKLLSNSPSMTLDGWIKRKLEARRQTRIAKRDSAYLRTLDRHLLLDMGIDISALCEIHPSLKRSPNISRCETRGLFRLPLNMSTR